MLQGADFRMSNWKYTKSMSLPPSCRKNGAVKLKGKDYEAKSVGFSKSGSDAFGAAICRVFGMIWCLCQLASKLRRHPNMTKQHIL